MNGATIVSYMLLPFFIYEINKSSRKGWLWVKHMSIRNYLIGYSCVDIESILWDYGIPTHFVDVTEGQEGNHKVFDASFYVPSSQRFMADCLLRQNEDKFGFSVMSAVVYQGKIPSTRYSNKRWKRWGVTAKTKSWTVRIGQLLFGHMLNKKKLPTKAGQQSAKNRQLNNTTKGKESWGRKENKQKRS